MSILSQNSRCEAEPPATFAHAFSMRVELSPGSVFVEVPDGAAVTYMGAHAGALSIRRRLVGLGIGSGDRVGLYMPNTPAWAVASLGVWATGASVTACGTLLAPEEARRAFEVSSVAAIITTKADELADFGWPVVTVDDFGALESGYPESESQLDTGLPGEDILADPGCEAVVFFTSGTTGTPKGVPHKHADLMHWAQQVASAYASTPDFRTTTAPAGAAPGVIFTPFGHIGGYLSLAFRVWIGRSAVLVSKFSTSVVAQLLERYDFQALQLTPTMIHMLATAPEDLPLGRLRYVTSSTAPLTLATRDAFESRFGIPIIQAYGMTEVGTISQERYTDVQKGLRPTNSVGRPAVGVEVRIVDESGIDQPVGSDGEIVVRASTAAMSDMGDHAAQVTAGWFYTGDLGRLDADGFLYVTGRRGDKIIVGGFNVYPAEVEEVLRSSEHVLDAVVVGVPDDRLGECPVALVVWRDTPQPDALREEARGRLAHYKVPRSWVAVASVPQTKRGKVDRRRVREMVAEAIT